MEHKKPSQGSERPARQSKQAVPGPKATHTPGPWTHACDSGYSSPCLGRTRHSKKAVVYQPASMATIASHITNWDDARLIAAAPDGYALIKRMVDRGGMISQDWDDMRAFIAKAEGR